MTEGIEINREVEQAEINRLAKLSALAYDQERKEVALALGVRASTIDKQVAKVRGGASDEEAIETLEPWPFEVDGSELAVEIQELFERHVVLPEGMAEVITLWTFGTYCFDAFRLFPKLLISSPEKRCGKTTLMETIEAVTRRAVLSSGMTPAVLFRLVQMSQPTLLLDEVDRWVTGDNLELVGVINAGHTKRSAHVWRIVGDAHKPTRFSVWGAMALAGIKTPADTIVDRSVRIEMRRRAPGESRTKLPKNLFESCNDIRRKLERWAIDNHDALRTADPVVPRVGNDRAEDNWQVLLAIATLISNNCYRRACDIFVRQHRNEVPEDAGAVMLLADIRTVLGSERIFSDELVAALVKLSDRPWSEWRGGKPLTTNGLARLLKPFRILPKTIRVGDTVLKGYEASDFVDAFRRYLPPPLGEDSSVTPLHHSDVVSPDRASNRNIGRNNESRDRVQISS